MKIKQHAKFSRQQSQPDIPEMSSHELNKPVTNTSRQLSQIPEYSSTLWFNGCGCVLAKEKKLVSSYIDIQLLNRFFGFLCNLY